MDTLRGSLETFGLDGVMNLITSTGKTGVLKAFSGRLVGRIYFRDGAIVYGTTRELDGYVTDLYQRQTAGSAESRDHERRGRTQTNEWTHPLEELVKQQIVDVFVRLLQIPGGQFAFEEGTTTSAYQAEAEHQFDPTMISELARERLAEWESIVALVPSPTARFRLADNLPPDQFEVTIDAKTWSFLATIRDGAAVEDIAERLRIFEFPAAKKVAEFVRRGLLVMVADEPADAELEVSGTDQGTVPPQVTDSRCVGNSRPADTCCDHRDGPAIRDSHFPDRAAPTAQASFVPRAAGVPGRGAAGAAVSTRINRDRDPHHAGGRSFRVGRFGTRSAVTSRLGDHSSGEGLPSWPSCETSRGNSRPIVQSLTTRDLRAMPGIINRW